MRPGPPVPPADGTPAPERDTDLQSTVSDQSEVRQAMHDIRNHLNGILGLVHMLLLQSSEPMSMRVRPLIEFQAQQLMDLIDNLSASVGGSAPASHAAPFIAARFVPALVELYRPFAAEYGVRLAHRVDDTTPSLNTDTKSLHRLLSNLLVNSIRHAQASLVTVFVEPQGNDGGVRLAVADDGVGIAADALSSLQAVLNGRRGADTAYDRSGLAICAGMADKLGATLTLQSDIAVGTTVSVDIPGAAEAKCPTASGVTTGHGV